MDAQGLAKVWLFPTLGMLYEEALKHDPGAVVLLFRAFNRWLAEDWGMAYGDRIFAAPYITLADVDEAVAELEWALDQDARTVVMRAAAPTTASGPLSPAADDVRPLLGPGQRGRHHGRRARRRRRAVLQRVRRRRLLGLLQGRRRAPAAEHQAVRHRAGGARLPGHAGPREALRPLPQRARRLGRERLGVPGPPVPQAAAPRRGACRATSARTRWSPSAATCGSTRSGRTTSTRSSTSWGTTGSSSARTGPTSRACPSPPTG